MRASAHGAAIGPAACDEPALRIELRRSAGHWCAAIEQAGEPRREIALSELIRWLADLSAGPGRPSHGLR